MSLYAKEIKKIKELAYSNDFQIQMVIRLRNHINTNYCEDLRLQTMSRHHFTSKFHLLRTFKRYYGQTPKEYLTDKRIEKAKEYLRDGLTVTDTCFKVGFKTPCSFSTLFKSRIGLTPTQYQKEQLSQRL